MKKVLVTYSTEEIDLKICGRHLLRYWNGGADTRYIDANLPDMSTFYTNTHLAQKAKGMDIHKLLAATHLYSNETTSRSYLLDGYEDERIVNLSFEKYVKASYEYNVFPATSLTMYWKDGSGGSGVFWITPEEKAWVEIDLGVYPCQVKDIRILWTSHKEAPKFKIFTSDRPYGPWKQVGDESKAIHKGMEHAFDLVTSTSTIIVNESSVKTRLIRLEMEGGKVSWVNYQGLGRGFRLTMFYYYSL